MDKIFIKGKPCSKYTILQLKDILRSKGLKVSGSKPELCQRINDPPKPKQKKSRASIKKELKVINVKSGLFKFYASTYYQVPGSQMAEKEMLTYGLNKSFLDKFKTHKELFNYLKTKNKHK